MNNNLLKDFIKYAGLNVLGMISISVYILADTFFIAKATGENGLAALNFSISIFAIMNSIGLMIGSGSGAQYSINISRNNQKVANIVFTSAIKLSLIFGLIFFTFGMGFSQKILYFLGARGEALNLANIYLKTIMGFSVFFILNNVVIAAVRNDSNPRIAMIGMVVGSLSNIVLDYIFMFIFNMGMFGAAFATCLSPIISLLIMSEHFFRGESEIQFLKHEKIKYIKTIFSLGIPSFITELSSSITLIVFNYLFLINAGNTGVAAYAIVANLALVVVAVFVGISHGLQPLSSKEHGKNNNKALRSLVRYSFILGFIISLLIYGLFYFNREFIVAAFNGEGNSQIAILAENGIVVYFLGFFFASINIISGAFFASIERPRQAFVISIFRALILLVPSAFICSSILGIEGIWISFVITEFLVFLLSLNFLRILYKNFK